MKNLTVTEQVIYDRLLKDKTEKEISEELCISKHTVKSYINMINKKCQRHDTVLDERA